MRKVIIPIFIPHKGCPHDCVFCNQKKISGHIHIPGENDIRNIIEKYLDGIKENTDVEIAFYGGSFTGIDYGLQEKYLSAANEYLVSSGKQYKLSGIRISTRPDFINSKIISLLKEYNIKTIELGVQSLDDEVLKNSGRGHNSSHVYDAVEMLRPEGFKIGIQTMIGLPGDTLDKSLETCDKVIGIRPDMVRIYPTLVIKDTPLYELYKKGLYKPLSLEEAVETTSLLLEKYYSHGINVIRVGLQPTDNIKEEDAGGDVVAGPMHPAFRQLAESRIAFRHMEKEIIKNNLQNKKQIFILADKFDVSVIIGHKKSNIKEIKNKYNIGKITIVSNNALIGVSCDFML